MASRAWPGPPCDLPLFQQNPLFQHGPLHEAFAALRRDLIHEDGPRISTMRNYRFAIVQYDPAEEFRLRGEVQHLTTDLVANGWMVISINLQKLFLDRVRAQGPDWVDRVVAMEGRLAGIEPERGLNYLKSKLSPLIEGPDGIAADCSPPHLRVRRPAPRQHRPHARPHRAGGSALPVLPVLGPAPPPRRQDAQRPGRPALPGRAARPDRALVHGHAQPGQRLPATDLSLRDTMLIRDLFASDVTRDIPPVVYFHEQAPDKLAAEVSEYIVTGGWPEDHPNHRRVPQRHPRAVRQAADRHRRGARQARRPRAAQRLDLRLLRLRQVELRQAARPRPRRRRAARRRLARGGVAAARHLAEVRRAPRGVERPAPEDRSARGRLRHRRHRARQRAHPRRGGPAGPAAARLLRTEPLVADFELRLERDGEWARFEETAAGGTRQALGRA